MPLSLVALLALLGTITLGSFRSDLNVGLIAIGIAYVLGIAFAGLSPNEVSAFLPTSLFLTIVGVTLLFEMAAANGTLDRITSLTVRLVRGSGRLLPVAFFGLTFLLSALGPGNIAATALIAPVAMRSAVQAGVSPLLMAILICTGANAGAFSPVALTGVINTGLLQKIGVTDPAMPLTIFLLVAAIQSSTAIAAYFLFGGHKAISKRSETSIEPGPLTSRHIITMLFIAAFIAVVMVFKVPVGPAAFACAGILALLKIGDSEQAVKGLPWSVIVLVSGISVLIGLLEETGTLALATDMIARYASQTSINAVLAFVTGLVSIGSSSSGVVMPLFIPLAPEIMEKMGGGDLIRAIVAIDAGSHMVDVSPLSTLGALCLAALPASADRPGVFRRLLLWGISMAFVGALLAWIFLDLA